MCRKLSLAIEDEAEASRHHAEYRLVRLVAPLGVAFALILAVALHAIRTFLAYQSAAEARVAELGKKHKYFKGLAERWAPLSSATWHQGDGGEDETKQRAEEDEREEYGQRSAYRH